MCSRIEQMQRHVQIGYLRFHRNVRSSVGSKKQRETPLFFFNRTQSVRAGCAPLACVNIMKADSLSTELLTGSKSPGCGSRSTKRRSLVWRFQHTRLCRQLIGRGSWSKMAGGCEREEPQGRFGSALNGLRENSQTVCKLLIITFQELFILQEKDEIIYDRNSFGKWLLVTCYLFLCSSCI